MWGLLGTRPRTQGWSEWGEGGSHRDICLVRWGAWAGARVAWVVRAGPDLGPWTEWSESGEGGGCTDWLAREWSEGGEGGPCTGGLGPVDGARGARSWTCRSASQQGLCESGESGACTDGLAREWSEGGEGGGGEGLLVAADQREWRGRCVASPGSRLARSERGDIKVSQKSVACGGCMSKDLLKQRVEWGETESTDAPLVA